MAGRAWLRHRHGGRSLNSVVRRHRGRSVVKRPRYRDAGIIMLVAAAIGSLLGIDIVVRAIDGLPQSQETLGWATALVVGAAAMFSAGLRMLRKGKEPRNDAF